MKREERSGGDERPRLMRPLEAGFWPDVKGAVAILAGAALGGLLFHDLRGLLGAVVGGAAAVIARAVVRRHRKRHADPGTD